MFNIFNILIVYGENNYIFHDLTMAHIQSAPQQQIVTDDGCQKP